MLFESEHLPDCFWGCKCQISPSFGPPVYPAQTLIPVTVNCRKSLSWIIQPVSVLSTCPVVVKLL